MNCWYSPGSGYFSVPRNSMCSRKCARPSRSFGSLPLPTATFMEAAALSAAGSGQHHSQAVVQFQVAVFVRIVGAFNGRYAGQRQGAEQQVPQKKQGQDLKTMQAME